MTREHDFCRGMLKRLMAEIHEVDPQRYVAAEVTGGCKIGNERHYWVKVTDHRFAEGARPTSGSKGHARFPEYEVTACCRYHAKHEAIGLLLHYFDEEKKS